MAEDIKRVVVETLVDTLLEKDPKSVEGKTSPQAVIAFSADAETAEEVRFIAHVAIETVRAQVLHTV